MITSFLELDVYKESFQLSLEMEDIVKLFSPSEKFLLVDLSLRAARSIPAQIAEGYARREALKDFQRYLRDCMGESNEIVNHLMLAKHKKYISNEKADELIERYLRLGKKLNNLKNNWQITNNLLLQVVKDSTSNISKISNFKISKLAISVADILNFGEHFFFVFGA